MAVYTVFNGNVKPIRDRIRVVEKDYRDAEIKARNEFAAKHNLQDPTLIDVRKYSELP